MTSILTDALAMLVRTYSAPKKYEGDSRTICRSIIMQCNTPAFFRTSCGHFSQFYCRDFGMCAPHLCELGFTSDVKKTLIFARNAFQAHSQITTTVRSDSTCVDYFAPGPDSLAFFLRAVLSTRDTVFINSFRDFFHTQAYVVYNQCIDPLTHRLKHIYFSSPRDHYMRTESLYDWCALEYTSRMLTQLGISHPFSSIDFESIIDSYWRGTHYAQDLDSSHEQLASDAQTFAFYWHDTLTAKQKKRLRTCIQSIQKQRLDNPVPIQYTSKRNRSQELVIPSFFAPNYEGNTFWLHTGLCYIEVVAKVDIELAQIYLRSIEALLLKHRTFLEVYSAVVSQSSGGNRLELVPYRSVFYRCDEGMLWCSIWLHLFESLCVNRCDQHSVSISKKRLRKKR
jgi:hypothetical protein